MNDKMKLLRISLQKQSLLGCNSSRFYHQPTKKLIDRLQGRISVGTCHTNKFDPSLHTVVYFSTSSSSANSQDAHLQYLNQIRELEEERTQLFGQFPKEGEFIPIQEENHSIFSSPAIPLTVPEVEDNKEDTQSREIRCMKEELEDRFQFTPQDYIAWTHVDNKSGFTQNNKYEKEEMNEQGSMNKAQHTLTHWDSSKEQVTMVDVGSKTATLRHAIAQSIVTLPLEVMKVLVPIGNTALPTLKEIQGPKGPIFATARIAGIMAAKRTSELIPLCHPLPLEKVNVDIKLSGNQIIIECHCSVTHKTGVEMEALMGASIAALTIYDMLKALSHHVTIENTKLIHKSGGKREFHIER